MLIKRVLLTYFTLNEFQKFKPFMPIMFSVFLAIFEVLGMGFLPVVIGLFFSPDYFGEKSAFVGLLVDHALFRDQLYLLIVAIGFYFVRSLLFVIQSYVWIRFVYGLYNELIEKFVSVFNRAPIFELDNINKSYISKLVHVEAKEFCSTVAAFGNLLVEMIIVVGIVVASLFLVGSQVIIVGLVLGLMAMVLSRILLPAILNLGSKREHFENDIAQILDGILSNIRYLRTSGRENFAGMLLGKACAIYSDVQVVGSVVNQIPRSFLEFVLAALLLLGAWTVSDSTLQAEVVVVSFLALRLIPSINRIISSGGALLFHSSSVEAVRGFFELDKNLPSRSRSGLIGESERLRPEFESLEARSITFSEPASSKVLWRNVSFVVQRAQRIAVIGPSGSGKSTLLDVLMGLRTPSEGKVFMNDLEVFSTEDETTCFSLIGYCPQEVFLFGRNIGEAISGAYTFDIEKIRRLLTLVELDDFSPHSPVISGGTNFSGGQKLRLGLCRALYDELPLIFLDEPTSALDFDLGLRVIRNIFSAFPNQAFIVVTHEAGLVGDFDLVLNLSAG